MANKVLIAETPFSKYLKLDKIAIECTNILNIISAENVRKKKAFSPYLPARIADRIAAAILTTNTSDRGLNNTDPNKDHPGNPDKSSFPISFG